MTAKGLANFSIALLSIATFDPGQARIATWPTAAPGETLRPLTDGWRALESEPLPDARRRPEAPDRPGADDRAIDFMPRSPGPAER